MTDSAIILTMKNSIVILLLLASINLNAQVLGIDRTSISVGSALMNETVDLCSDTTWTIQSSQTWLKVAVRLFWSTSSTSKFVTLYYSGTAPDIGWAEYLQDNASGHDSAFVYLIAEPNLGAKRTAIVTVQGTNVVGYSQITVTQLGLGKKVFVSSGGKLFIDKNGKIIVR
jgi:hypothetical protein